MGLIQATRTDENAAWMKSCGFLPVLDAAKAYNAAAIAEFGEYATINNLGQADVG